MGGGSTEFAVGSVEDPRTEPEVLMSVDIGCVRFTEMYLKANPPSPRGLNDALSLVRDNLSAVSGILPSVTKATQMVLVGGTVTRLPAVTGRLTRPGPGPARHSVLTLAAVEDLLRTLATREPCDRGCRPGLEAAVADVMLGGTAILAAIMRYFGFEQCLVSDADIVDGMVLSLSDGTWPRHDSIGAPRAFGIDGKAHQIGKTTVDEVP
jgi:exopolyphosphatase/guanosine-5'-triphosphate,3'-diphosphate pyrophosphatase